MPVARLSIEIMRSQVDDKYASMERTFTFEMRQL